MCNGFPHNLSSQQSSFAKIDLIVLSCDLFVDQRPNGGKGLEIICAFLNNISSLNSLKLKQLQ